MDGSALRILSKRFAGTFLRRHPSARHLKEELEQEAAVAILRVTPRYRREAGTFETFCYLPVLDALQQHCARLGRAVGHSRNEANRDFLSNTNAGTDSAHNDGVTASSHTPSWAVMPAPQDDLIAAREASETINAFLDTRLEKVGSRLPKATLKKMMLALASGDTLTEAGNIAGVSRERARQLKEAVGLGDLC